MIPLIPHSSLLPPIRSSLNWWFRSWESCCGAWCRSTWKAVPRVQITRVGFCPMTISYRMILSFPTCCLAIALGFIFWLLSAFWPTNVKERSRRRQSWSKRRAPRRPKQLLYPILSGEGRGSNANRCDINDVLCTYIKIYVYVYIIL